MPAIVASGRLVFVGRGVVTAAQVVTALEAAVTYRGAAVLVASRASLVAQGTVGTVPVVSTTRPRLRSLPEPPARVRVRRVSSRRLPVQSDAVDVEWQRIQQERDEAEALMLVSR